MMRAAFLTVLGISVAACQQGATLSDNSPTLTITEIGEEEPAFEQPRPTMPRGDTSDVQFEDILAQYQALNTRLSDVSSKLRQANAALCPLTLRDVGFTAHTVRDYPQNLREVAREFLGVDDGLSVRTVRAGSSADMKGVKRGDRLVGIDGRRLVGGSTQQRFYDRVTKAAFAKDSVAVTLARKDSGAVETIEMTPETLCGYPVDVFFDENINGHTDGKAVWITSQLMRTVDDDVNLSLIVAHEMAHAIAGHMSNYKNPRPRKELELTADRMAMVMMARADLDLDRALSFWEDAPQPYYEQQDRSLTHPSIDERIDNLKAVLARIKKARAEGAELDFSLAE